MEEKKTTTEQNDTVGKYLVKHLDKMLFDEFSDEYLEKAGIKDILKGVPVPFKAEELTSGQTSAVKIAANMAFVLGCDRTFKYRDNYLAFISKCFPKDFDKPILNEGVKAAQDEDPETACIYFRAALLIDPESKDALFLYARALKDAYDKGDTEEYVGTFKAESLRMFEHLTIKYPDFDQGFYFLGYGYLNLGLYTKARLTFEEFVRLTDDGELKKEVEQVIEDLKDPCVIEEGMNDVAAGRFDGGINKLSRYADDPRFSSYWPLWYYLGIAYKGTGNTDKAVEHLKKGLTYSPSNTDMMKELVGIYEELGEEDRAEKYRSKIKLVEQNRELDKEEKTKGDYS